MNGELEKYALPRQSKRQNLQRNASPIAGLCAIIENGVPCTSPARQRGLCIRHYQNVWQRGELDQFVSKVDVITRNPHAKSGICVVREQMSDGVVTLCDQPSVVRGLCRHHYRKLVQTPTLFDAVANPVAAPLEFRLKTRPKDDLCVVVENGFGCTEKATRSRRVCDRHFHALRRAGKLQELTDTFLKKRLVITSKAPAERAPGFCIMSVNGVPCINIPRRRGLCNPCIHLIEKAGSRFEDFALPLPRKFKPVLARKSALLKGVCAVTENGRGCDHAVFVRGLCKIHYKMVVRRKALQKLALTPAEAEALPDIPHFYFDKNVVIRFALFEMFRTNPDPSSVHLVEAVLKCRIRATVSLDCLRAVYSHLGHRLARSKEEGGKGMDQVEAEALARKYVGNLFFERNGLWGFLPFDGDTFNSCTRGGMFPNLSLEDALEMHSFSRAKCQFGAEMFVTADGGILQSGQGVHPQKILAAYPDIFAGK
jgi:hypothetical protein